MKFFKILEVFQNLGNFENFKKFRNCVFFFFFENLKEIGIFSKDLKFFKILETFQNLPKFSKLKKKIQILEFLTKNEEFSKFWSFRKF